MTTETYTQIVNQPFYYINGLLQSNDATTPNTKIDVTAGICRDSTNSYDMNIGNFNGVIASQTADTVTIIDATQTGLNGLDTGSLGASKLYYIYAISDPFNGNPSGCMVSLNDSVTAPVMPFGYSAYRHVGFMSTDASSHFLKCYQSGHNSFRQIMYDAPQATAITAGAATSYTAIDLTGLVPVIENTPVWIASALTPGAASRTLSLQPVGATGDSVIIVGQVTSVVIRGNNLIDAKISSSKPEIAYKVTNAGDAAAINVAGYQYSI